MREPVNGLDYTERDTAAIHSVLIELAQVLGAQSRKFVLVGGSVPGLLFPEAKPEHIGTLDIDIELNPKALGDYGYVDIVQELESHGYERGLKELKPFQLLRTVQLDDGLPIKVIVDLLMPDNSVVRNRQEKIVDGLTIQRISGGNIAIEHAETLTLKGKMPDGRSNEVSIFVASIPALLVMKGYAIGNRDKEKDAYDIWYCIKHYAGGVEVLAEECLKILNEEGVKEGYQLIAQKFKEKDGFGPQTVRKFLQERPDQTEELDLDQIQTDAHLRVLKWCELLGLLNG